MVKLPRPNRPLLWIGSSRKDYGAFPPSVQDAFGFEAFLAQTGQHPPSAKPLKGFPGAIYTVRFETVVYVLHAFKKKSKRGIKTPQSDIDLIKRRLRDAEADSAVRKQESRP